MDNAVQHGRGRVFWARLATWRERDMCSWMIGVYSDGNGERFVGCGDYCRVR